MNNSMRDYILIITLLIATTSLANAQIKSVTSFIGECENQNGDNAEIDYCDANIINLNFIDGFMSFQFNSRDKTKNGRFKKSISFIGSGLKKQQDHGKDIIYLPVDELTFANGQDTKLDTRKVENSVCLLGFYNGITQAENLRYLQCHYQEQGKTIVYKASNLRLQKVNEHTDNSLKFNKTDNDNILHDTTCKQYILSLKENNQQSVSSKALEKLKSLQFSGVGPLYTVGALACECKMRGINNLDEAIKNIDNIHKSSKKYNVPYNIIKSGILSSFLADNHSPEWRTDFHNWIRDSGEMPKQDADGNFVCAIIDQ